MRVPRCLADHCCGGQGEHLMLSSNIVFMFLPVLCISLQLSIAGLLRAATFLCTHHHWPSLGTIAFIDMKWVWHQHSQVGVFLPVIVVIPCTGDDILCRPQNWRYRGEKIHCSVFTMGASLPQGQQVEGQILTRFIGSDDNTIILNEAILFTEHIRGNDNP